MNCDPIAFVMKQDGIHKMGYNGDGYDVYGFNSEGYNL